MPLADVDRNLPAADHAVRHIRHAILLDKYRQAAWLAAPQVGPVASAALGPQHLGQAVLRPVRERPPRGVHHGLVGQVAPARPACVRAEVHHELVGVVRAVRVLRQRAQQPIAERLVVVVPDGLRHHAFFAIGAHHGGQTVFSAGGPEALGIRLAMHGGAHTLTSPSASVAVAPSAVASRLTHTRAALASRACCSRSMGSRLATHANTSAGGALSGGTVAKMSLTTEPTRRRPASPSPTVAVVTHASATSSPRG